MSTMKPLQLWAWRYSVSRGWDWSPQRICTKTTGPAWLAVYKKDEPDTPFVLATTKPKPYTNFTPAKPI